MKDRLASLLARLRRNAGTAGDLTELRRALLANPAEGLAAVLSFLATGEDAATGQSFTVGPAGTLTGAPTLRLFLLDVAGQLARMLGSTEAATYARQILEKKDSPEEWALALRNVAWAEPRSRPFLAERMHELLGYEPWLASPTPGVLESFDVAVFSGDPTLVPALNQLASGERPELAQAATIALDRLAEKNPLEVMNYLNANPEQLAERPFRRADYFAKADLGNLPQRQAVERYLDRADVALPEKSKLLHAIASPGSFVADSLLTRSERAEDETARDASILTTTQEWLVANRFPALRAEVMRLQESLSEE